jgi:hypothetical protein
LVLYFINDIPFPGLRCSPPIHLLYFIPSIISKTSTENLSHILAILLIKVTLIARKAFEVYLIKMAVRDEVTTMGALNTEKSSFKEFIT